jgi:GntR family transcriptional regulator of vanillate catabolism
LTNEIIFAMQKGRATSKQTPGLDALPTGDVASQTARALVEIRRLVLAGELRRGKRISEVPLSKRLGMSRTPMRMALERLAHVGLVEEGPNGGFFVKEFTIEDVHDAIELRGVLEGTAARLAAERLTDSRELDRLLRLEDQADSAALSVNSFGEYMDANEQFHAALVQLAKSSILSRLIKQVVALPFASPSAMVSPTARLATPEEWLIIAKEQHRGIIEAIRDRAGTRAEHLAREHAHHSWVVFQTALSKKDGLAHIPGSQLIDAFG